jgi:hypothetical protein
MGGIGVELVQGLGVLQVVGLPEANETLGLGGDEGLDVVGLDHTANIGVGEDGTGEEVSVLHSGGLVSSSEDSVELLESGLGPDNESAKVTSRGELQEVQGRDTSNLNTSQISEGSQGGGSLVGSDDEGSNLDVLGSVPQASLTRVLGNVLASVNIGVSLELGQEGKCVLGLGEGLDGVSCNNQGDLGDGRDVVSTGQYKCGHGGGGECGGNSVSLLVHVDLAVPPSPGTSGGKHSSTTAHVTESSLTCTVCSTTGHPGNTCHSPTSTPRSGRGLCASPLRNRVGYSGVLAKVGLDILDDVISDGCIQHGRGGDLLPCCFTIPAVYLN